MRFTTGLSFSSSKNAESPSRYLAATCSGVNDVSDRFEPILAPRRPGLVEGSVARIAVSYAKAKFFPSKSCNCSMKPVFGSV